MLLAIPGAVVMALRGEFHNWGIAQNSATFST